MARNFNRILFNEMPVIGIVRNMLIEDINSVMRFFIKAGFTTLEVTMNTKNVESILSNLSIDYPNLNIGAGTVCSLADLEIALEHGASFIVTPVLNEEVINECVKLEIPIFPGALTPTEIYRAYQLGATAVKVFPARQFGPQYIKDVIAPLSNVKLIPTGGVSLQNIDSFFDAGAIAVGMGGSLFKKELITNKDYEGLSRHFNAITNKVSSLNV